MRNIEGFPGYTISDDGKIYRNGRQLHPYSNGSGSKGGYMQIKLWKNGKRYTKQVHRLVMGDDAKGDVDHIDGNPHNNNLNNLQVLSHRDNVRKAFRGR